MMPTSASVIKHAQLAEDAFVLPLAVRESHATDALAEVSAGTPRLTPSTLPPPTAQAAKAPTVQTSGLTLDDLESARKKSYEEGFDAGMRKAVDRSAHEMASIRTEAQHQVEEAQELQEVLGKKIAEASERATALDQKLQMLDETLKALNKVKERCIAEAEDDLLAISFEVATQVFEPAVMNREALYGLVRKASAALSREASLAAHVHPEDRDWLMEQMPSAAQAGEGNVRALQWVADSSVKMGGCILQGEHAALDARLEQQLDAFRVKLVQLRAKRDPARPTTKPGEADA